MESESSEYEDEKIEIVEKSIPTTETDEVIQLAVPLRQKIIRLILVCGTNTSRTRRSE